MAIAIELYLPVKYQQQICNKTDAEYYCKNSHVQRYRSEHTCASAVYYCGNVKATASQGSETHLIEYFRCRRTIATNILTP